VEDYRAQTTDWQKEGKKKVQRRLQAGEKSMKASLDTP
jgi:hypothetical protein